MILNCKRGFALIALSHIAYAWVCAQNDSTFISELDNVDLDEVVVVSSNREETKKHLAPSMVQVLNTKKLEQTRSCMIAEALPFQAGVRVEDNCQNCGFKQARINGLDGHYSQILINSHPMFSAVSNLYGLEQIPTNMISQVEVMRGGGSALYGASAVAGTINIVTKEPERNGADASHTFSYLGNGSCDNNTAANASVLSSNQRAGLSLFVQNRSRQGYSYYDDGYTNLPSLKTTSLGTNLMFRTSNYSKLKVDYSFLKDDRRGGNKPDSVPERANIAETAHHEMHNASVDYGWYSPSGKHYFSLYTALASVARNSYTGGYGEDDDPDEEAGKYYSKTDDLTWSVGGLYRLKMDTCWFMPADLTVGAELLYDHINDCMLGFNETTKQNTIMGSVYAQNEWKTQRWSLLLGLRLDKHNLIEHPILSPRVNVRFSPTHSLSLRATFADGFRAPQIFDEDLHIEMAAGNRFKVLLKDGLKEERSHSYTLSAEWTKRLAKVSFQWMSELFLTDLNDIFVEQETDRTDDDGCQIIERYNGVGALVMGVTTDFQIRFAKVEAQVSVTAQRSEYDEPMHWSDDAPDAKRMFRSPNLYGYMDIDYSIWKALSLDVSGTFTGPMWVQHMEGSGTDVDVAVKTPCFWDCNAQLNYSWMMGSLKTDVSVGVRNIFNSFQKDLDRGPSRDGGYIYGPSLPRNYFVSLALHL